MKKYEELQCDCKKCCKQVIAIRETSFRFHIKNLFLTIITLGLWYLLWTFFMTEREAEWICCECGRNIGARDVYLKRSHTKKDKEEIRTDLAADKYRKWANDEMLDEELVEIRKRSRKLEPLSKKFRELLESY